MICPYWDWVPGGLQGPSCERTVAEAIEIGYRAIDTAELYGNETQVGRGIKGVPREDLFIPSKVSGEHLAPVNIMAACQASLERLHTSYLDLYLVHWPNDAFSLEAAMAAMNELIQQRWVRSIGVSNFDLQRQGEAIAASQKPICANQIEYHPYIHRRQLSAFCAYCRIAVIAYSPLARGKVLRDPMLNDMGRAYGKSATQVSLKWLMQQGYAVIPKATSTAHLHENADLDDWTLSPEDMARIEEIDIESRLVDRAYT
ncbi:MAG: aldo/keto reductase [Phycisphaeraceae bacterium]|nr:aldo/keto reductase [Phycisphaeraceae bacterium]